MAYDPFGINGGATATATKGTPSSNYTGGTAKSAVGRQYDPFGIGRVDSSISTVATPKQVKSTPQKSPSLFSKVGSGIKNIAVGTVHTGEKAANTVGAGLTNVGGLAVAGTEAATGHTKAAKSTLNTTQKASNALLDKGIGNQGAYINSKQAASRGTGAKGFKNDFVKPTAQAVTDIAPLVIPVGKVAEGASLATKVVKGAVENATVGAGTSEANQALNGGLQKKNFGQTVKAAATAGILGAVAPILHEGIKTGKEATSTAATKDLIKNQKTQTLLDTAHNQTEVKPEYTPSNPKVKTLMEARQKQADIIAAPAKEAEQKQASDMKTSQDNQIKTQKIDRQVELIQAKGKDSETGLSNVDKTKLGHLQEDKQQLTGDMSTPKSDTVTAPTAPSEKPSSQSSNSAVTAPVKTKVSVDPNAPPERGTSKVAQDIQTKAVAKGLKNTFGDAAGYDKINIENMAKKATAITNDPERLNRIIDGSEKLPSDVRPTALITAVENHPTLSKDPELINRLSQAEHLTGESSRSAQELRLAAERNPHSPVEAIKSIRKARVSAVEHRIKTTVSKAINNEAKSARSEIPRLKVKEWHDLVDSLKC